jgi:hypothetical protein
MVRCFAEDPLPSYSSVRTNSKHNQINVSVMVTLVENKILVTAVNTPHQALTTGDVCSCFLQVLKPSDLAFVLTFIICIEHTGRINACNA